MGVLVVALKWDEVEASPVVRQRQVPLSLKVDEVGEIVGWSGGKVEVLPVEVGARDGDDGRRVARNVVTQRRFDGAAVGFSGSAVGERAADGRVDDEAAGVAHHGGEEGILLKFESDDSGHENYCN
jgi:hypothetical protein